MIAPTTGMDLGREFRDALPNLAHRGPAGWRPSGAVHLPQIQAALGKGWTIATLAAYCSHDLGDNPGAVVSYRLKQAATGEVEPTKPAGPSKFTQPLPWCGGCSDPAARWAEDSFGAILGRCPRCWTQPS